MPDNDPSDLELALNILESDFTGDTEKNGVPVKAKDPGVVTNQQTISSTTGSVVAKLKKTPTSSPSSGSAKSSEDEQMQLASSANRMSSSNTKTNAAYSSGVGSILPGTQSIPKVDEASGKQAAMKQRNHTTMETSDPSAPIILSHAGWASSHPALLTLIEAHKTLFAEECDDRVDPKKSIAVNRVIQKLVKDYAPKILLETTDAAEPLKHTQIKYMDILIGGAYHSMMVKKVKECFERQSLETAGTLGAESPPPRTLHGKQTGQDSPDSGASAGAKRLLSTRTTDGTSSKKPSHLTPVRTGVKHDLSADKTPIVGNKKQSLRDVVLPRSASRAAARQAKRLMQEIPTSDRRYVRVDQLTYDWSSLRIDGAAAWNRFLQEKNDPHVELQPPVVTSMDTYQLVQSVKSGLATITPPPGSYLYDALSDDFDPMENQDAPKTRLMTLFREMADYETSEVSKHKQAYNLMKAKEIRDYLVEMEKDIAELDEIGSQLDDQYSPAVVVGPTPIRKTNPLEHAPIFWQKDFAALCDNKSPATQYLMTQDQY